MTPPIATSPAVGLNVAVFAPRARLLFVVRLPPLRVPMVELPAKVKAPVSVTAPLNDSRAPTRTTPPTVPAPPPLKVIGLGTFTPAPVPSIDRVEPPVIETGLVAAPRLDVARTSRAELPERVMGVAEVKLFAAVSRMRALPDTLIVPLPLMLPMLAKNAVVPAVGRRLSTALFASVVVLGNKMPICAVSTVLLLLNSTVAFELTWR